jgi:hypothetical protein
MIKRHALIPLAALLLFPCWPSAARGEAVTSGRAAEESVSAPPTLEAPAPADWTHEHHLAAMVGLAQWLLLRGGNVALEYRLGRLALEVSHGQGLDLNQAGGVFLTADERRSDVRLRVPWTTGFGVGYRITENLHALVEFKAHHYEVTGLDPAVNARYTTFSIGPGVFYTIHLYQGLFLEPNIRYWPNVASTLDGGRVAIRQPDGTVYDHRAHDFGFFANMNLGYLF